MSNVINSCEILLAEIPLKSPYVLSFGTVNEISSIIVRVSLDNDQIGWAEAVPLPGYSQETRDSILNDCRCILPKIIQSSLSDLGFFLNKELPCSPFVRSAIYSAYEMAASRIVFPDKIQLPVLAPISAYQDLALIGSQIERYYRRGYRTIKVKTGKNIVSDLQTVSYLLDELPEDMKVRIDANQGYSFEEATAVLELLDHPGSHLVELIEQPFGIQEKDWQQFARLAKLFNSVPLMLDESIFSLDDVQRAADSGASFVKLKLFKHQGIGELLNIASYAVNAGLKVVLGNGVSSDIGNLFEAAAFQTSGLFYGAFEGNGFDKLKFPLLRNSLRVTQGNLAWEKPVGVSIADLLQTDKLRVIANYGG